MEELLLEFYEDFWEQQPEKALAALGAFEDDVVFETGDAELDSIERRLAAGEDPDEVLKDWGSGGKGTAEPPVEATEEAEFEDDFTVEPASDGLSWAKKGW